ncbi:MAG: hypothetical protein MJE66_13895 [Proteobacteria bacterium]|nr:hypothetical protein [Pseudomonadota bacterium]
MSGEAHLSLEARPLERVVADVAVVGLCAGELPLRGDIGRADWRLCGVITDLLVEERLTGAAGEVALLPSGMRLGAGRLVVLGLGPSDAFRALEARGAAAVAVQQALALGGRSLALSLPLEWDGEAARLAAPVMRGVIETLGATGAKLAVRLVTSLRAHPGATQALDAAATAASATGVALQLGDEAPGEPSPLGTCV